MCRLVGRVEARERSGFLTLMRLRSGRLRERLQKDFGGLGAGAYAVIPATRKISIKNEYSSNWIRRTGFGPYVDTIVKHKKYGALFSFCEIEPIKKDSSLIYEGWIKIGKPTKSYKHSF